VPLRVDVDLFARYFASARHGHHEDSEAHARRASDANLRLDLARIGDYLDRLCPALEPPAKHVRYLDVGAGMGASVLAARERGWRPEGVEINVEARGHALARGVSLVASVDGARGDRFDLVSLWESLEHMNDPAALLSVLATRLAPGGLVALTIPNLDSAPVRLMRGDCPFVGGGATEPGHINLFGRSQLRRLCERAGLYLVHVDGEFGSDYLDLAGYLLGRHRGARSLLGQEPVRYTLPATLAASVNAAGPALALIDRSALRSPILFAVACRAGDAEAVARAADHLDRAREASLSKEAERLAAGTIDFAAHAAVLQAEVDLRDRMLMDLQATANELQATVARMRDEANRRDGLLARLQARLGRGDPK
jgi:SAM-dependent methyltransferase